jgi:hypothetical protein
VNQTSYSRAEAQAKVGRRVCTRVPIDGVPQGTVGTVTRVDRVIDGYDLEIEWAVPKHRTPVVGWCTKTEYERDIREL